MSKLFRQLKRSLNQAINTEYKKQTGKRDWKYELSEIKYAFLETMLYSWVTPIQVFWESLYRIAGWLPILWKDRDWIDGNIFLILRYRIKRARDSMAFSYYANADEYARQMRIAELLLERLQDSNKYVEEDWEQHWKQWPSSRSCDIDEKGVVSWKDSPEQSKDVKRMMTKEEYMWQQDFKYLCNHMRKHIRKWGN